MTRLLVVADSDSYAKWGAALASRVPDGWASELVVLRTPVEPSARQLRAALAGSVFAPESVRSLGLDELVRRIEASRPDVVLLSLRGPLVRVVAPLLGGGERRPVLVSGMPGLTIPAEPKAIVYREQVDLIVLHSRREVREFTANAGALGVPMAFGLSTLPFLPEPRASQGADDAAPPSELVFAAQAKVPAEREERVRMLAALADAARRRPERRVVVKVRARRGEAQTHAEAFDYAELLEDAEVRRSIGGVPPNLVVEDGPMGEQLRRAGLLVTVSSTAVLEAIASGVSAVAVDDFGVGPKLINTVFEGSGLFGGVDDVAAWAGRLPDRAWLADNYFHGRDADDWTDGLAGLLERRAAGPFPLPVRRHNLSGGALRRAFERKRMLGEFDRSALGAVSVLVAIPARWVVRRLRRTAALPREARTRASAGSPAS